MNITSPGKSRRMPASAVATPSRMAVCESCPHVHLLGHGQRIHVRTQGDARPGLAALENADHAGMGDAGLHFQSEFFELIGDDFRRAEFAIAELGMRMDIATPARDLAEHRRGQSIDIDRRAFGVCLGCAEQHCKHDRQFIHAHRSLPKVADDASTALDRSKFRLAVL